MAGGEARDLGEGLAVEKDEEADDTVDDLDGVVMQEAMDQAPPVGVVGQRPLRLVAGHRGEGDRVGDVISAGGPQDESAGFEPHHGALREPGIDVVLPACGERDATLPQPVKELSGLGEAVADVGRGVA